MSNWVLFVFPFSHFELSNKKHLTLDVKFANIVETFPSYPSLIGSPTHKTFKTYIFCLITAFI